LLELANFRSKNVPAACKSVASALHKFRMDFTKFSLKIKRGNFGFHWNNILVAVEIIIV